MVFLLVSLLGFVIFRRNLRGKALVRDFLTFVDLTKSKFMALRAMNFGTKF